MTSDVVYSKVFRITVLNFTKYEDLLESSFKQPTAGAIESSHLAILV